jgi:hypothetical protein
MNERAKVLLGALAALFFLVVLLAPPVRHGEPVSKPLSTDRGDWGLMGLQRWLGHNDLETASLRRRYTDLTAIDGLDERGNLLITSLPHGVPARPRELDALREWVGAGNAVLLLTAEQDMPEWQWMGAMRFGELDGGKVLEHFGFTFEYPDDDTPADEPAGPDATEAVEEDRDWAAFAESLGAAERRDVDLQPRFDHPRLRGVDRVTARSIYEQPHRARLAGLGESDLALALLEHGGTGRPVFWEATVDQGRLWVSAYPDLFGNITLGKADNARFLTGLLRAALAPGGRVVFDDFHFGLSDLYDPAAFFADRRLHMSLFFILTFWLAYVAGRTGSLAPPHAARRPPRESDFVEALAGLSARRLKRHAVASGLAAHFFNELRRRHRRPENGQPAWDLRDGHAAVPAEAGRELRRQVEAAESGGAVKLDRFTRLLNNIRKAL